MISHPHGRAIGPESCRIIVSGRSECIEVFGGIAAFITHLIGINLVVYPV